MDINRDSPVRVPTSLFLCLCIVLSLDTVVWSLLAIAKPSSLLESSERWLSVPLFNVFRDFFFFFNFQVRNSLLERTLLVCCNCIAHPSMTEAHSSTSFIWRKRTMFNGRLLQSMFFFTCSLRLYIKTSHLIFHSSTNKTPVSGLTA